MILFFIVDRVQVAQTMDNVIHVIDNYPVMAFCQHLFTELRFIL